MRKLIDAAASGDLFEVTRLVARGADVNAVNQNGSTPLHWAAYRGHAAVVEFLIANGVGVETVNMDGDTALHWAADGGHVAVVEHLVAKGTDVNAVNKDGLTPLHQAAASGHAAVVEFLVSNGADVNAVNKYGDTPLQLAAWFGHAAIVEFLKQAKAAQPKTDDRRDAVLALLAEDDTLRRRLGIKVDLEVALEFDVEHLVRFAVSKRGVTDPTLAADVEAGIQFHMQAAKLHDRGVEYGNPMRP